MWKKLNALCLTPILIALSGCVHGSTAPVIISDYCKIAAPISYDSAADTPATVAEIEKHNSQWVCVCEDDCPEKPSATKPIP